jgi:hypothetical protein
LFLKLRLQRQNPALIRMAAEGDEEAFEMRDLDTGQQHVIFDLESGAGVSAPRFDVLVVPVALVVVCFDCCIGQERISLCSPSLFCFVVVA